MALTLELAIKMLDEHHEDWGCCEDEWKFIRAKLAEAVPSASANSDYAAALRVIDEFVRSEMKDSVASLNIWCKQRLHSGEPNVA